MISILFASFVCILVLISFLKYFTSISVVNAHLSLESTYVTFQYNVVSFLAYCIYLESFQVFVKPGTLGGREFEESKLSKRRFSRDMAAGSSHHRHHTTAMISTYRAKTTAALVFKLAVIQLLHFHRQSCTRHSQPSPQPRRVARIDMECYEDSSSLVSKLAVHHNGHCANMESRFLKRLEGKNLLPKFGLELTGGKVRPLSSKVLKTRRYVV